MLIDSHYIIIPLALFPICAIVSVFQIFEVNSIISLMMRVIAGVSGVVILFAFFRRYEDAFTKDRKLGRILQYVGRRTLDVYLLHYFILPHNMNYLGDFFANNPNPQLEFIVSISIAAYVVALCLIVSNIIRLSDILSNILFGVNSKPNSSEISK